MFVRSQFEGKQLSMITPEMSLVTVITVQVIFNVWLLSALCQHIVFELCVFVELSKLINLPSTSI